MGTILNVFKNKKTRTWGILGVLLVIGILAWTGFASAGAANATAESASQATVVSLQMEETVEASGSLEAQPFAALKWKTGGVVEAVNVQPGDVVKAGEILATLQPSSTSASIVSAQADLVNAREQLDNLLHSNTDFAQVVVNLKEAQEDFDEAQDYLTYLQNEDRIPQTDTRVYLQQTPGGYRYDYKVKTFKGPATEDMLTEAENDLALKKAKLEDLQREYDRLKDGPNAQDILAAQARVDAAQATVNMLSIIAPFDGVVLSVDDRVGDVVNANELSVNVADLEHLFVEAQVDESDVAKVREGNPAQVTLDALPGLTLTGRVAVVNPVGEVVGGLVKYNVRIDLDPVEDMFLPLGSTANVVITVAGEQSMLAVPIVAIQNDANGEYVWVVRDGAAVRVDVIGGAIYDDMVAVTGDLQAGDVLEVVHENSFAAPNPFGGQK
jgi:HlyD family secretion protein